MNQFRLDDKVALVTGGSRGIGAAIAETLVNAGAKVVISDILVAEGEKRAALLGDNAIFLHHDVAKESDWDSVITSAVKHFGGMDILVNNAGIETAALFADCTFEEFTRTMNINAGGTFLGIKHGIRAMRPSGISGRGGSITNISSGSGIRGTMALGAYCASKAAIRLMTKAAAIECARLKYGIRVNSIHPGVVRTDMGKQVMLDYVRLGLMPDEAAAENAFETKSLLGLGVPQDVANGVWYLASDAARWLTGIELPIDGGNSA
jgi:3alpha(or 20beta)-hydroxysteroid dehydrogenase